MISATDAERIVLENKKNYGTEMVSILQAIGRVSTTDIHADRAFPPFDRVAMDGIAINYSTYQHGLRDFKVEGIAAAGKPCMILGNTQNCIEVMTGAVLPQNCDTVIPYEHISLDEEMAHLPENVVAYKNVHKYASDIKENGLVIKKHTTINPIHINILATIGMTEIEVKKMPRVCIISSGDELVHIDEKPLPHQIRRSNVFMLVSLLRELKLEVNEYHLHDTMSDIVSTLSKLEDMYDVLIISGGVSKGKFDYIPKALEELNYEKLFHRVNQRPGKPFWFGKKGDKVVFALPGNPIASIVCLSKYFVPWLKKSMSPNEAIMYQYYSLTEDFTAKGGMTFFPGVQLIGDSKNELKAHILSTTGSADLHNNQFINGFIEFPAGISHYDKNNIYKFIPLIPS